MNRLFFSLVRNALGTESGMEAVPSEKEWNALYGLARKQTLTGICFAGVQHICSLHPETAADLPAALKMKWLGAAAGIQKRNDLMDRHCVELQKMFDTDGMRISVLKGQAVGVLYGKELAHLRQPGDIDVYVDCDRKRLFSYLGSKGFSGYEWDYVHCHPEIFRDTEVEVHYRLSISHNFRQNRKLQQFWSSRKDEFFAGKAELPCGAVTCPSGHIHLIFLMHHAFRHLISGGIGLRQLMDIYFAVLHRDAAQDRQLMQEAESIGLGRFAPALMWVLREVFALPEIPTLWAPDEKEGRFLLDEIMRGGNFGQSDPHSGKATSRAGILLQVCRHDMHLATHYGSDAVFAPLWYIWHFFWKRFTILRMRWNGRRNS